MMGLQQFFGLLATMDCTEDLIFMTLIGLIVGAILGVVGYHLLKNWD
jgi:hypothetical protein